VTLARAAAAAALLASAQIALAEVTGLATFAGPFDAGNDRVIGVASSLLVWFCALAVILGASAGRGQAILSIVAAVLGTAAGAAALLGPLADPVIARDVPWAIAGGTVLGTVIAALLTGRQRVATAIAVHAATVWGVALIAVAFVETLLYPGLVELLGVDALRELDAVQLSLGYHFAPLAPFMVIVLVVVAVTARRMLAAGTTRPVALAGAASGPVIAAAAYFIVPGTLMLWNADAAAHATALALASILVAALAVAIHRRT
jgi:hypothetical protein